MAKKTKLYIKNEDFTAISDEYRALVLILQELTVQIQRLATK